MRVGFAGLGRMGAHMARNLSRAGHKVTLWNRTPGKAQALAAELAAQPRLAVRRRLGALELRT